MQRLLYPFLSFSHVGVVRVAPLALPRGLEPRTIRLTVERSAIELEEMESLIGKPIPTFR